MISMFYLNGIKHSFARYSLLALLLIFFTLSSSVRADNLTASVDRNVISLQETLTLTLRFSAQTSEVPNYSALQNDFDVLSTQQSNQMRIINGAMESYTDWRVVLAPKRVGTLTIPAFTVKGERSDPINITVESQSQAPQNTSQDVFVEAKVEKNSVYVQEQILLTLRLYTSINLTGAELQPLEIPDALVVDLGDTQFQATLNGKPHIVVERVYSIFPQHSGELVIPSLTYNVSVSAGQRDIWGNRGSSNLLRLRTEEKKITVNTIPQQFNGQPWMPAQSLELREHWSSQTDRLKVGEPVTRTITLVAEGLTAGQLSPLPVPRVDGLTFYPDQAQNDDQNSKKGVQGSRIETIAIVPNRSGKFTLPAVSVNWWDTRNQKMQTAVIPAKTLTVDDTAESLANLNQTPAVQQSSADTSASPLPINTDTSNLASAPQADSASHWLQLAVVILALLTVIFAALYWRTRRALARVSAVNQQDNTQSQLAENAAWVELKRASAQKDYPAMRSALLQWAQAHWQDKQLLSLSAVAQRSADDELAKQLQFLDAAIYRGNQAEAWDSGELLQQVNKCRKQKREGKNPGDGLAPLYKN